jgi:hypothetical protein
MDLFRLTHFDDELPRAALGLTAGMTNAALILHGLQRLDDAWSRKAWRRWTSLPSQLGEGGLSGDTICSRNSARSSRSIARLTTM